MYSVEAWGLPFPFYFKNNISTMFLQCILAVMALIVVLSVYLGQYVWAKAAPRPMHASVKGVVLLVRIIRTLHYDSFVLNILFVILEIYLEQYHIEGNIS